MNVVFLDIDGVMNHRYHLVPSKLHGNFEFCPKSVENLKQILTQTDSKIVLSSYWRLGETVDTFRKKYLCHYNLDNYLVGLTPFSGKFDELRGEEIQRYIDSVNGTDLEVTNFVIIDDDKDMGHLIDRLVHCNDHRGLSEKRRVEAINILSKQLQ